MLLIERTIVVEIPDDKYDETDKSQDEAYEKIDDAIDIHFDNIITDVKCIASQLSITAKEKEIF